LICQIWSEQELPDNTFIMLGWEAPRSGSAQIYTVLVETGSEEVKWDVMHVRDQYVSFHNRLRKYTKSVAES
jgi:hypothetical protein